MYETDDDKYYSPDLVALLNRHHENETLTRKQFATAADTSDRTADRVFRRGWQAFEQVQRTIRNLPLCVSFDVLTLLVGGRFTVEHRGAAAEGCEGVRGMLRAAEHAAQGGLKIARADEDSIRTDAEHTEIAAEINAMRRILDALETENDRKRARRQTA